MERTIYSEATLKWLLKKHSVRELYYTYRLRGKALFLAYIIDPNHDLPF